MSAPTQQRVGPVAERALAIGDVVEVKPAEEILAGLDERGELDTLPFMPEMLQFCGRRFVVDKIAFKTCDTVTWTGLRRMDDTVHLTGVRCDGQAHGGCQAGCLVFWKTAWLTRVSASDPSSSPDPGPGPGRRREDPVSAPSSTASPGGCTRERLTNIAHRADRGRDPGDGYGPAYSCQATELTRAAPAGIPFWHLGQYVRDVRSGNAPTRQVVRGVVIGAFNRLQELAGRRLPQQLLIRGGSRYPFIHGTAQNPTPVQTLDLQPGEWVKIKSLEEITSTINGNNTNRGLTFDPEMLRYCGRTARVLRRVDRIIDESSGRMLTMKTPCIVLTDVTCTAEYHRNCPRSVYPYWREIWLERVAAPATSPQAAGETA